MTAIRIFDVRFLHNRDGSINAGAMETMRDNAGAMETMRDVVADGKKIPVVRDGSDQSQMPKHALGTDVLAAYDNGLDWSW